MLYVALHPGVFAAFPCSSIVPKLSANSGWPALFPRDSANTKAIVFFPAIHVPSFLEILLLGQCHFIKRVLHSRTE